MDRTKRSHLDSYARNLIRIKARQLVGKAGFTADSIEDLEQEMTLDLLQRLPRFDSNKAAHTTFVARVIDRKISNLIRHRTAELRDFRRESGSLNDEVRNGSGETDERAQTLSRTDNHRDPGRHHRPQNEDAGLRLDFSVVLDRLPPDLRQLAELLTTCSISEAARKLGVPRSTLRDNDIARLRELFESEDLRGYL